MKKYKNKIGEKVTGVGENIFRWATFAVLGLYCISLCVPLFWMLYTSVKVHHEYVYSSFALPAQITFANFAEAFNKLQIDIKVPQGIMRMGIAVMAKNSIVRSALVPLLTVFVTYCVAYVVASYEFIGRRFIFNLGIVVMILPIIGSFPSTMMVSKALNVYDNMFMYIITRPSVPFGMNFLLLHGMIKGLPKDYREAALIDGAGHYTIFFKLYLPMSLPTCAVLYILAFLGSWNDYQTPMMMLPSYPNLAYGMYYFERNAAMFEANVPTIMAGFTIIMLPTAILYLLSQKLIVSKFTVGGLKG